MAEEKEVAAETTPKKPARKRATSSASEKSVKPASKASGAKSSSPKKSPAQAKSASAPPPTDDSKDLWDQTADSLSEVDWSTRGRHLFRLVLMLFAGIAAELSVLVVYFLTAVHFLYTLVTAKRLDELTTTCGRFSAYVKKLLDFISYRSDEPLFPFAPFPEAEDKE